MDGARSPYELFSRALEMPEEEREAFLEQACSSDRDLLMTVKELLDARVVAKEFLDRPSFHVGGDVFGSAKSADAEERCFEKLSLDKIDDASLDLVGSRIGPFKLRKKIGEGGMGVVYLAEQKRPVARTVAVKLIRHGMDTRDVVARFDSERQALALMNHAGIARIYDAGLIPDGRPYFAMEHVCGLPITDYCDREELSVRARLEVFLDVCDAVQHAHQKGIIHRDLKPSNVLVGGEDGTPQAKVIDFGVAKATDRRVAERTLFTRQGVLVGTPTYMSPEQAAGAADTDTRSDIYSLGVILYELLVGALPFAFEDSSYDEILRTIREVASPRPSTRLAELGEESEAISRRRKTDSRLLTRVLRGELDWIVLKALEKDRGRRYGSASELRADIVRFLSGEPVLARRPSAIYRVRKAVARNRALALASVVAALLLVGGALAVFAVERASRKRLEAVAETRRVELYPLDLNLAFRKLGANRIAEARDLLDGLHPRPGERDLRGFEWSYLHNLCRGDELATLADGNVHGIAFSPEGRYLAYGAAFKSREPHTNREGYESWAGGAVLLRDARTLEELKRFPVRATTVSFSPDGEFLVAGSDSSSLFGVRVWETATGTLVYQSDDEFSPVAFSPDGRWLVACADGALHLRAIDDWELESERAGNIDHWNHRHVLAFSPDSRRLVFPNPRPTLLELPGLGEVQTPDLPSGATSTAFLPGGRRILFGHADGTVSLWDLAEERIAGTGTGHQASVTSIVVLPGHPRFATASDDRSLCLWDLESLEVRERLLGHESNIWGLSIDADGSRLASGSFDATVKIWSTKLRSNGDTFFGNLHEIGGTGNSTTLLGSIFAEFHLHDLRTRSATVWDTEALGFGRFKASVSLEFVAAVLRSEPGTVEVWHVPGRERRAVLATGLREVKHLSFSADERQLVVGSEHVAALWDLARERELRRFEHEAGLSNAALVPDDRLLITTSTVPGEHPIHLWDLRTGEELARFAGNRNHLFALGISRDGRYAAAGGAESIVSLIDLEARSVRRLTGHAPAVVGLDFSPDGRTLASVDGQGTVRLWSVATGVELMSLELEVRSSWPYACPAPVRFSPDGQTLAASETNREGHARIRYWSIRSLEEIDAAPRKPIDGEP